MEAFPKSFGVISLVHLYGIVFGKWGVCSGESWLMRPSRRWSARFVASPVKKESMFEKNRCYCKDKTLAALFSGSGEAPENYILKSREVT